MAEAVLFCAPQVSAPDELRPLAALVTGGACKLLRLLVRLGTADSGVEDGAVGDALGAYDVTVDPPLAAGAVQATLVWALPTAAETAVGASGKVRGVAETGLDDVQGPTALSARNRTVYDVP